ncbi:MAG TPA: glycosyltransferase family 4 protein [Actinomycetota bacterium]|nr:glycosyltransferase family 4 protein [Actinomycetota bacterium]
MRILVISSYPPRACGVGAYAEGQVERLRAEGHDVTVISPLDGRGDIRMSFDVGRPLRVAARRGGQFERIIVHFQPGIYYRPRIRAVVSRVRTSLALLLLVRRRPQTEILIHEAEPRIWWHPSHVVVRRAFARASLLFHTDAERSALEGDYRVGVRARLVDHREGVVVRNPQARQEARRRLGIPSTEALFLCAGFLHPKKGYERAVQAFEEAGAPGQLVIVGSVRDTTPQNLSYTIDLRSLAERTDGVTLIEAFLSDDDFNTWLAAADHVVLPYTGAWSSGVLARASVIGTPAIISAVGGLAEQAGPRDEVFHSDEELRRIFRRHGNFSSPATGRPRAAPLPSTPPSASS